MLELVVVIVAAFVLILEWVVKIALVPALMLEAVVVISTTFALMYLIYNNNSNQEGN